MEQVKQDISTGKKFIFLIISLFAFFVLIEGLISIYFYRQNGGEMLASIEAVKTISKKFSKEKDLFVYEPWVEYRYNNRSITTQEPVSHLSDIPGDTLDIYFFGGVGLSGVGAGSSNIPSEFIKLYKEKFPRGKSVRLHNYGSPHYYSYQEMVLLSSLIQNGHRPDIVVYLDGINDFRFGIPSYYRQSYFSYIFRQFFNSGLRSKGNLAFVDTAYALSKTPDFISHEEFSDALVDNYISNIKNISMLAEMIDAKAYFFCEPSPYFKTTSKQDTEKDVFQRFDYIYPQLQQMQDSIHGFTYIANIAESKDFTNGGMYTAFLTRSVAEKIFSKMLNDKIF